MIETMITSSVLIVVIIGIRYLFSGKISYRLQYALWGLVLLRLCLPFTLFSSPISVMNVVSKEEIQYEVSSNQAQMGNYQENIQVQSPIENVLPTRGDKAIESNLDIRQKTSMTLGDVIKNLWIIGSIAVGIWFAWANFRFYLQLRNSRKLYDKAGCKLTVYITEDIASPCLFGILRPAIYLTPKATESNETLHYVITHELCHFRHIDYIWSVMRGICLAIYWWNPLIWVAAVLSRTDSEFACDEAVIAQIGENNRLVYGRTIIDMIAVKRAPIGLMCVATAMTSGKQGIKQRLNIIIRSPKTFLPAIMAVLIIATLCVGCTFTGAKNNDNQTESKANILDYAQELYDCRNPYIGDAPANSALLTALNMPENLSSYTLELETEEEPYILRLMFTNDIINSVALDRAMNENAMLLLALIDNVSAIQWRYTYVDQNVRGSGIFTGSLNIKDATAALNGTDIKSYGQSVDKVQELLDWLETGSDGITDGSASSSENVTGSIDQKNLEACISNTILEKYAKKHVQRDDLDTEAHTILKTVVNGSTTTVYAMALHMNFGYADGGLYEISSSHMPVAITFEENTEGEYELKEYWDGSYPSSSIEEDFPVDLYEDNQDYIVVHTQDCYKKAVEYGEVDTNVEIGKLFETISASPAEASNPKTYIDAHQVEYTTLLYYGDYTLRYVFSEFLTGGQTGLKSHIMIAVMRDLIGGEDMSLEADTPQHWFDEWKEQAVRILDANSMEFMEKNNPKAYILLLEYN